MGTDLDLELSADLQARADAGSAIDPEPLLAAAMARGRRIRTRRRIVTAVLAVAAVAAGAVTTVLPRQHPDTSLEPAPSSTGPRNVNLARLPAAAGQPGATARPDLVGTDPGVLHFSVDALAAAAARVAWTSAPGVETADVQRTDFQVYLVVAQTAVKVSAPRGFSGFPRIVMSAPVQTSVAGRAATIRTSEPWQDRGGESARLYAFKWQPVHGLWARFEVQTSGGQERALQILQQISFDQARRCALPIRLDYLPPGATVPDCVVDLNYGAPDLFSFGNMTVIDNKRQLSIQAEGRWPGAGEYPRPLKAGPYQVYADPGGGHWTILSKGLFITASIKTGKNSLTQAEVFRVLAGIRIADQVGNPGTW